MAVLTKEQIAEVRRLHKYGWHFRLISSVFRRKFGTSLTKADYKKLITEL